MTVRDLIVAVWRSFRRNRLTTLASAMAFQVLFAIVPALLFLLAVLGFLGLEEVWRKDVAPEIEKNVSEAAFRLMDDTVEQVLTQKQFWWLSIGLALTVWQLAGATRVTMLALDRVYDLGRRRGFLERLPRSIVLGVVMGLCVVAAIAVVRFGPLVTGELDGVLAVLSFIARWLLAIVVLGFGIAMLVHFGAGTEQEVPWVSFGTGLVLVAWVVTSIAFGVYVRYVASYASVFGHLTTFYVLILYLYLAAHAFLAGLQLDACVRERA